MNAYMAQTPADPHTKSTNVACVVVSPRVVIHPNQFSVLPSERREVSTGQSAMMSCGWDQKQNGSSSLEPPEKGGGVKSEIGNLHRNVHRSNTHHIMTIL